MNTYEIDVYNYDDAIEVLLMGSFSVEVKDNSIYVDPSDVSAIVEILNRHGYETDEDSIKAEPVPPAPKESYTVAQPASAEPDGVPIPKPETLNTDGLTKAQKFALDLIQLRLAENGRGLEIPSNAVNSRKLYSGGGGTVRMTTLSALKRKGFVNLHDLHKDNGGDLYVSLTGSFIKGLSPCYTEYKFRKISSDFWIAKIGGTVWRIERMTQISATTALLFPIGHWFAYPQGERPKTRAAAQLCRQGRTISTVMHSLAPNGHKIPDHIPQKFVLFFGAPSDDFELFEYALRNANRQLTQVSDAWYTDSAQPKDWNPSGKRIWHLTHGYGTLLEKDGHILLIQFDGENFVRYTHISRINVEKSLYIRS